MDIEEMKKMRVALEDRLCKVAVEIVGEFQQQTGLAVNGVYIDTVEERVIGARRGRAIVTGARLSVDL